MSRRAISVEVDSDQPPAKKARTQNAAENIGPDVSLVKPAEASDEEEEETVDQSVEEPRASDLYLDTVSSIQILSLRPSREFHGEQNVSFHLIRSIVRRLTLTSRNCVRYRFQTSISTVVLSVESIFRVGAVALMHMHIRFMMITTSS